MMKVVVVPEPRIWGRDLDLGTMRVVVVPEPRILGRGWVMR